MCYSGLVLVWFLCLLDACHQLTQFVEEENCFIQWSFVGNADKRRELCFKSVNWNIFASQRAHFPLTVRRCSSVEEQLSWLDSNGKHTVRLVTNQKCVQDCMGTRVCMTNYWACFSKFLCWSSTLVMVRSNCYHICEIFSVIGVEYCLISQVKCAIYHNDTIQGCCN